MVQQPLVLAAQMTAKILPLLKINFKIIAPKTPFIGIR
jgi:hypothetical protein